MAVFKRTQVSVDAQPLVNGQTVHGDEAVVQSMWNAVRSNFTTDMKALQFSSLERPQKHSWAVALKRYIDGNDDIQVAQDSEMKVPNGNIQISRVVTIKANETNALNFGPAVMLARRVQEKKLLLFSVQSYKCLKSYIESVEPRAQTARSLGNAFALAALMSALSNLNDDDD